MNRATPATPVAPATPAPTILPSAPTPTTATPPAPAFAVDRGARPATHVRGGLRVAWPVGVALALVAMFLALLMFGSVNIPLGEVVRVLMGGAASRAAWTQIILNVRLPEALTAVLAGAALAVGGLQMQTLFRNPLADPFVLGVSSGASLGVALAVLVVGGAAASGLSLLAGMSFVGDVSVAAAASVGAGLALALVLLLAGRATNGTTLLIVGVMMGYLSGALVSLLLFFTAPERAQAYLHWTFGSFGGVTWRQMAVFVPLVLVGLAAAWAQSKTLNALMLGDTYAQSVGVPVRRARAGVVVTAALLAGAVTAFCGPIAFIGIAAPHLCRITLRTADHAVLLPMNILMGALLAVVATFCASLPSSALVLPLNAVTAALGAPLVLWLLLRARPAG
jgi:iron complex transport system permease protein